MKEWSDTAALNASLKMMSYGEESKEAMNPADLSPMHMVNSCQDMIEFSKWSKESCNVTIYWLCMDADILAHIKVCHRCQQRKKNPVSLPTLLMPLPLPTKLNMIIHCTLYRLLPTSENSKKYILAMTDAFTKYFEFVTLPSKEASVVTEAIFKM